MDAKNKALAKKTGKEPERKMLFTGKIEHKNGHYFASGNRTNSSEHKYTHEGDRKYGASGMGGSHAEAIGSLMEEDHRMRHGRSEIKTNNPKFKMK
jgi:hypothetical protein